MLIKPKALQKRILNTQNIKNIIWFRHAHCHFEDPTSAEKHA